MLTTKEVKERIVNAKRVAIFGHVRPDLDCFGSMFGAKFICESLGTKCDLFSTFSDDLFLFNIFPKKTFKQKFDKNKYDLILIVDCNSLTRIDKLFRDDLVGKKILIIDHHELYDVEKSAECYVFPGKCAASLVVFELIEKLKLPLDSLNATYIFAGLIGDTGRFLHTNTDINAFTCAAKLCKIGADIQRVYDVVYRSLTMSQVRLGTYMFNNLRANGKVCYLAVSKKDLQKLKSTAEDLKMFVDDVNKIKEYNVVMIAYEREENKYVVSMRSKNDVAVDEVAEKYGGGGHKIAAGFRIHGNKRYAYKKLKEISGEF